MKTSFHTSAYRDRDIEEIVSALTWAGMDGIEIDAEGEGGHLNLRRQAGLNISDEHITRVGATCERYHLPISSISAHFSLIWESDEERDYGFAEYKRCIDQAVTLGGVFVHGFSGWGPRALARDDEETAWALLKDGCIAVLDYAKSKGIKFGIEPVINHLVHGYDSLSKLYDMVGRDDFYMNYDPIHFYVSGSKEDYVRAIRDFGNRILHVHVHDGFDAGRFKWEQYKRTLVADWGMFTPPSMGEIDFTTVVSELKAVGYEGYLSMEYPAGYLPQYKYVIDMAAKQYNQWMKGILAECDALPTCEVAQ